MPSSPECDLVSDKELTSDDKEKNDPGKDIREGLVKTEIGRNLARAS